MNIQSKINLAALKNAAIIKSGKNKDVDCLIIPIEQNNLFVSDKGAVYLDLYGFENKEVGKYGDTHMIKQSLSKEKREAMTEEEQKAMPILGNHKMGTGGASGGTAKKVDSDEEMPF